LNDTGFVEDDGKPPHDEDENQKPEPNVERFSLLRLLRIYVVFSRIVSLQLSVSQLAAFLQARKNYYKLFRIRKPAASSSPSLLNCLRVVFPAACGEFVIPAKAGIQKTRLDSVSSTE
jgi:hypothetical protein